MSEAGAKAATADELLSFLMRADATRRLGYGHRFCANIPAMLFCVDITRLYGLLGTATPIFAPTNATCNGKPGTRLSRLREAEGSGRVCAK